MAHFGFFETDERSYYPDMSGFLNHPRRQTVCGLIFLVVCAAGPFLPAIGGDFIRDDRPYILDNMDVQLDRPWMSIFSSTYPPHGPHGLYRPLTTLSFRLDRLAFGNYAPGFRVINLFWHMAAVLVAWLILRRCQFKGLVLIFGGAVFAVHPTHLEVAAEITGRAESMAFVFGGLAAWLATSPTAGRLSRITAGLSALAAVLSKENGAVIAPAAGALLYHFGDKKAPSGFWKPVLAGVVSGLILRLAVLGSIGLEPGTLVLGERGFGSRVLISLRLVGWDYPAMIFLPQAWRSEYPALYSADSQIFPAFGGALILLLVLIPALRMIRRDVRPMLAIVWHVLMLLPVLHLLTPIAETAAMRFYFAASLAPALLLAWLSELITRSRLRLSFQAAVLIYFAAHSAWRAPEYKSEKALVQGELSRHADAPKAAFSLAAWSTSQQDPALRSRLVAEELEHVLKIYPRHGMLLFRRVHLALESRDYAGAMKHLAALELVLPKALGSATLKGLILRRQGNEPAALKEFERARELSRFDPVCRLELAHHFLFHNNFDRAEILLIEAFRAALAPENHHHLLSAFEGLRELTRAGAMEREDFDGLRRSAAAWISPRTRDQRGREVLHYLMALDVHAPVQTGR